MNWQKRASCQPEPGEHTKMQLQLILPILTTVIGISTDVIVDYSVGYQYYCMTTHVVFSLAATVAISIIIRNSQNVRHSGKLRGGSGALVPAYKWACNPVLIGPVARLM